MKIKSPSYICPMVNCVCKDILFIVFFVLFFSWASAQSNVEDFKDIFRLTMSETPSDIILDGIPNETAWQHAEVGSNFYVKVPYFAEGADPKTEVRLTYDDKNLYVSAICYQAKKPVTQSLKRDAYWENDGI